MIALDTNILLRLVLQDDKKQAEVVARFLHRISEDSPAYISLIVLVELVWVLQKHSRFSRKSISLAVGKILETREFLVEHEDIILDSFNDTDFSKVDIADWLIWISGQKAGCIYTVTFDQVAAKHIPGMELLT